MARLLFIVDPQTDFIAGSLPVPGAVAAMNALAAYARENAGKYAAILATADRHPANHVSFKEYGGQWPAHCVAGSEGASIWPPLWNAIGGSALLLAKGENAEREEYSIFQAPGMTGEIKALLAAKNISDVDICGLAGDVCVLATLRDGLEKLAGASFHVLTPFSPSLDGGKALGDFISGHLESAP